MVPGTKNHYYVPATDKTVHWGYFSKSLKPLVEVDSGDFVTIEVLTHHANDDAERMIKGDPGAESVFYWDKQRKGVDRRGAGPMQPTLFGRGAGEGLGVHICTGPVAVREAEPPFFFFETNGNDHQPTEREAQADPPPRQATGPRARGRPCTKHSASLLTKARERPRSPSSTGETSSAPRRSCSSGRG